MSAARHQLPDNIASPQDLSALILELRDYARWSAHVAAKKKLRLKHSAEPPAITPTAKEVLKNWLARRTISEESLDKLTAALEEFKRRAPTMTITLAAIPSAAQKRVLVAWCRENISPDVLVSFQCSSTMLGGLSVRYGSRIFDWSFRRSILANRAKFPEVLRRV